MHKPSPWSDGSTLHRCTNSYIAFYADLRFFTSNTSVSGGGEKDRDQEKRERERRGDLLSFPLFCLVLYVVELACLSCHCRVSIQLDGML